MTFQVVALEKVAFDAAFSGKENTLKATDREIAKYIKLIEPAGFAIAASASYNFTVTDSCLN